jgi:nucleotide-binding universal stress UspA family protein
MYSHILLPTDGSELSHKAVMHGIRLAKVHNARVTGLSVILTSLTPRGLGDTMVGDELLSANAEMFLAFVTDEAKKAGVACDCFFVSGDSVAEEIVRAAESTGSDLVCMSSHGRMGLRSLLMGSETTKVLHYSKVPVLVVR